MDFLLCRKCGLCFKICTDSAIERRKKEPEK
ncbi:MAG: hypothetical protein JRJ49_05465 [Deltaproteobacteria bacterium]|nr:hypothetical protein [Deltaproteobacteria bacterium]